MADDMSDPTAGRRARMIREHPEVPQPITDPTDPRCGSIDVPREGVVIQDPTDPRNGEWVG